MANALPLRWTTEKPTVPGWYWYQHPDKGVSRFIIELRRMSTGELETNDDVFDYPVRVLTGEWAGPLPEPEEGA